MANSCSIKRIYDLLLIISIVVEIAEGFVTSRANTFHCKKFVISPLCRSKRACESAKITKTRCQVKNEKDILDTPTPVPVSKGFNVLELTGSLIPQGVLVKIVKTGKRLVSIILMFSSPCAVNICNIYLRMHTA